MEVQINVYPQQENVEIVTEPNVTNINVTTYAVINPQVYDLSDFTNVQVDRFAKLSDIVSSIAGYATEAWVNSRGFITNVITALGFTPENVANKAINLAGPNQTTYPTTLAVVNGLDLKQNSLGFTPENVANKNTSTSLGTSDSLYPTQNAVKTYVDTGLSAKQNSLGFTPENVANKSTTTSLGTSDSLYPTQNAVKTYVDTGLSAKQNTLGFTPENVANKATSLASPNNTTYPTTQLLSTSLPPVIIDVAVLPVSGLTNAFYRLPINELYTWNGVAWVLETPTQYVFVDSTPSADVTATVDTLVKTYSIGNLKDKKMIEFTALAHKIGSAAVDLRISVTLHNTVTNTSVGIGQAVSLTTSGFVGKQNTIAIDANTIRQLLNSATAAPSVYNWYSVNITQSAITALDPHEIRVFIRNGAGGSGIKLFMFKYEIQ
jgi:hypothetical protein